MCRRTRTIIALHPQHVTVVAMLLSGILAASLNAGAQAVTVTVKAVQGSRATVTWTAVSDAKEYVLQKRLGDGPAGDWLGIAQIREHRAVVPNEYERSFRNLTTNTEHCFRVKVSRGSRPAVVSQPECTVTGGSQSSSVSLALRIGPFTQGPRKCTGRVTWRFTPVTVTGDAGKGASFDVVRDYDVNSQNVGPIEWWCFARQLEGGVRGGIWRIQAIAPVWTATCDVSLHGGNNLAQFTHNRSGCKENASFP